MQKEFKKITPGQTLGFLSEGLSLALSDKCRLYILVPVLINLVLMSLGGYAVYAYTSSLLESLQ